MEDLTVGELNHRFDEARRLVGVAVEMSEFRVRARNSLLALDRLCAEEGPIWAVLRAEIARLRKELDKA